MGATHEERLRDLCTSIASKIVLERPLCGLDVETTGIHKTIDRIVKITVAKIQPDGSFKFWSRLIDPQIPIPTEASDVHGITDEMVKGEPVFAQLAKGILAALDGADLMAYNGRYDMGMMQEEFLRCGIKWDIPPILDPLRILHKFRPRTLAAVYENAFGEPLEGAHDSDEDVIGMLRYFNWQLDEFELLPRSVPAILGLFSEAPAGCLDRDGKIAWRNGQAVINFGKHAGKPLSHPDVRESGRRGGKSFLQWILDNDFRPDTKQIARDAIAGIYPVAMAQSEKS